MKEYTIGPNDAGQRLDRWLGKTLPLLPAPLAQKYIRIKRVKLNGKGAKRDTRLVKGDLLQLYINDEFFDSIEIGILIGFDEMYADKRDRHKEPYFKHLAETYLSRRAIRAELSELKDKLLSKNERQRARRFNAFLKKKKKIEKVEP